jgi:hypothetical protein
MHEAHAHVLARATGRLVGSQGHGTAAIVAMGGAMAAVASGGACHVDERCYTDDDCVAPKICCVEADTCAKGDVGECGYACVEDDDCSCPPCVDHECRGGADDPITCPDDMANVANCFCIDRYEAARPDATESAAGTDESRAVSRAGVEPWRLPEGHPQENELARAACQAAGKDLCPADLWKLACKGAHDTIYGYGDAYEADTCNGIDREFGQLLPTGSLPECKSEVENGQGEIVDAIYDMNGNLWEHVLDGSPETVRGGAYNCRDSQLLHRCDYVPGDWSPSARGFRCCVDPRPRAARAAVATKLTLTVEQEGRSRAR